MADRETVTNSDAVGPHGAPPTSRRIGALAGPPTAPSATIAVANGGRTVHAATIGPDRVNNVHPMARLGATTARLLDGRAMVSGVPAAGRAPLAASAALPAAPRVLVVVPRVPVAGRAPVLMDRALPAAPRVLAAVSGVPVPAGRVVLTVPIPGNAVPPPPAVPIVPARPGRGTETTGAVTGRLVRTDRRPRSAVLLGTGHVAVIVRCPVIGVRPVTGPATSGPAGIVTGVPRRRAPMIAVTSGIGIHRTRARRCPRT